MSKRKTVFIALENNGLRTLIGKRHLQNLLDKFSTTTGAAAALYDSTANSITDITNQLYKEALSEAADELLKLTVKTKQPAKVEVVLPYPKNDIEKTGDSVIICGSVPVLSNEQLLGACLFVCPSHAADTEAIAYMLAASIAELYDIFLINSEITVKNEILHNRLETMKLLSNTANVGLYVVDYNTGEIILWNNTFCEILGLKDEDVSGKICWELIGYKSRCPFCKRSKILDDEGNIQPAYTWVNHLGPPFSKWFRITDKALIWEDGRLVHMLTIVDVTEHYVLEDKLNKLAYNDRKLNMPNNISLERDIKKYPSKTHLLVIDIEGLRKINNVYGRALGDLLLSKVRDYLQSFDIPENFIYRLDVADFGILLEYSEEEADEMNRFASVIYDRSHYPWQINQNGTVHEIFVSVNICIVPVRGSDGSFYDLTNNIEQTLDLARKNASVTIYDKDTSEYLNNKLRLELSLSSDIKDNMRGFYLSYQPIINAGVAMWTGLEVLCRWNSSALGATPPSVFIPLAETYGHIRAIGEWVIENSIMGVTKLGLHKMERFFLNINLSSVQLLSKNIDKQIISTLEKYGYPPEKLGLEITESAELNYSKHTIDAIERLSKTGVIITMENFGTEVSSFNRLVKVPAKVLKASKRFVDEMETDDYLQHLFRVMVDLARSSKMKLIATGIETKQQLLYLLNQGIDLFQGYYFSYPLTIEEVEANIGNFHTPSGELISMGYSRLDISRLQNSEAGYFLTSKLYKLLTKCMQVLFNLPDGNEAINIALRLIGEGLNISRSYVFIVENDMTYTNTHEWCAENILPEKQNLQRVPVADLWIEMLVNDGIIISQDTKDLPEDIYEFLQIQNIKAVLVFPIWRDNRIYGFVGLDDCVARHNWSAGEVQMLHNLTGIITSVLYKVRLQDRILEQGKVLENVLNNMNTSIYVSDLETNEILFANSKLINDYGKRLKGNICWEALQGYTEPCSFCPLSKMEKKLGETYEWEFYNNHLRRYYRITDSIIQWTGGKLVHLEYAEDITDIKNYQSKLEVYASTDMFTSTLNRASFIAATDAMLTKANISNLTVTLAFIDIDYLKKENDTYGHEAGDRLITNVVTAINRCIRDTDEIGRYGGDEFIVSFYNCTKENAEKRMLDSLKALNEISIRNVGRSQSFSYGLVESCELPYAMDSSYIDGLINIADGRMFEQKKAKRSKNLQV